MSELPAGRELDCEVAMKVFGGKTGRFITSEEGEVYEGLPMYSTDIAAAWEVVGLLANGTHGGFDCGIDWDGGWWATFEPSPDEKYSEHNADTAPLAICRAALKALASRDTSSAHPQQGEP